MGILKIFMKLSAYGALTVGSVPFTVIESTVIDSSDKDIGRRDVGRLRDDILVADIQKLARIGLTLGPAVP